MTIYLWSSLRGFLSKGEFVSSHCLQKTPITIAIRIFTSLKINCTPSPPDRLGRHGPGLQSRVLVTPLGPSSCLPENKKNFPDITILAFQISPKWREETEMGVVEPGKLGHRLKKIASASQ